jgi:vacuolar-type H+-ATPase subunit I/STV1
MSTELSKTTSGGDPNPSGTTDGNPPEPKNDVDAILAKNKELLEENRKAKNRLAQLESERKKAEEQALKDKEDYKTLAEQRSADLEAANKRLAEKEAQERDRTKLVAVLEAVGGAVERKYWGLIDLEQVVIDPTTGDVDKTSVAKYVDTFRKEHPALIQTKRSDGLPTDAPKGGAGKITHEEWLKLPAKEMAKRLPDVWGK